jgi:hypothetical protein
MEKWPFVRVSKTSITDFCSRARRAGKTVKLHISRQASSPDLARFAAAITLKSPIPMHLIVWDNPQISLPPLCRLIDSKPWDSP